MPALEPRWATKSGMLMGAYAQLLAKNEDELLNFVARVNKVYHENLKKAPPFMTFVLCGMQSSGKSTIMERFLGAVLNIVQEGTGTRCPLDTTCIHDESCAEPRCTLNGEELDGGGINLSGDRVFQLITNHNKRLGGEDRFSTKPLRLEYRARNVQNMRFVDTPGIIANRSTGSDNREDIKEILRSEMSKANTKLCVLLEPKEFATNSIIDFCDDSLGGRQSWIGNATFLMNKFDKQLNDSRAASKANAFFMEFHNNSCFPYLANTPSLAKENLPTEELFHARKANLVTADSMEKALFSNWRDGEIQFNANGDDEELSPGVSGRSAFWQPRRK